LATVLRNLTVLTLEQATTLPFLTYRLACDGARVIRVEHPRQPDPNRFVGRPVLAEGGMNSYFLPNNCGKEAITLNLAEPDGRAILHELIRTLRVDVFACNQRPRSYQRLGIDHDALRALRPELIWLGISGFGPEHDEAAYDPVLQARLGFMALTGEAEGPPTVFGLPMVDLGAAEHGYGEVMKALYQRTLTGRGSRIDISMLRSAVSWMVSPVMLAGSLGESPARRGTRHQFFAPVSVYRTGDDYIYLAVGSDRQWAALTGLPAFATLARPEYEKNSARIADGRTLDAELAGCLARLTTAEALEQLRGVGVPVSKVQTVTELLADPLVAPKLMRVTDARSGLTLLLPSPPVGDPPTLAFPPRLGEHNERVYGESLGYGPERLTALTERGII
jgi:crotonobetainyl-CoA:carnitine CoA-transferase CaiB-like acyl-CoA transferase